MSKKSPESSEWLIGAQDIAGYLGITRAALYQMVNSGDPIGTVIKQSKKGGRWRALKSDIDRVLSEDYRSVG